MIGVEWGTSLFRAWRFGADGTVRDRRSSLRGLLAVPDFRFSDMLREELGRWIAGGEDRVLICGPLGSPGGGPVGGSAGRGSAGTSQSWRATRAVACPCGTAELAAGLADVPFEWAQVKLVPGIRYDDPEAGISETLNGEETHLLGAAIAIGGTGLLCLPGPMSCWARLDAGRVIALSTHLTGEVFAALRGPLLGRTARDARLDSAGFDHGVARASQPGGLLRHLAELRAEAARPDAAAVLFGLLVGHETRWAMRRHEEIHLLGPTDPAALHARAIRLCGGTPLPPLNDTVVAGLAQIGARANWG